MGALLLLAAALSLLVYAGVTGLPRYSPRQRMISRLGPAPAAPPGEGTALARRLRAVPLTRRLAPVRFRAIQAALAGAALALTGGPWLLFGLRPDLLPLAAYTALAWAAPEVWLRLQARRRAALIAWDYPDLLAHLVAQTRAGAGTLRAFASSPPVLREPLRGEVEELVADLRIAPFPAALGRFAERCGTPEVRAFARNVIYQQSVGIALPEALAAEETQALAVARQAARQRVQRSAMVMALVTVVLLLNGLLICFTPALIDLVRFTAQP
jgi:Flp pilus assembly protein TadB